MKKQRGITLTGLIMVLAVLIAGAILGFKLFNPYTQNLTIQKTFKALAQNPELRNSSRREILNAYQRYSVIDTISAIGEDEIEIKKEGDQLVISAKYSVKVPLMANVSLLVDFAPSSDK